MPIWEDIKRLWVLAWPVTLVHLVTIGISITDVAMVSRYSAKELAYLGVARFFYWFAVTIGYGLLAGMNVFPARADGAGKRHECGAIYRQGTLYALALGFILMALEFALAKPVLGVFGYAPDMVNEGADYLHITAIGIPYYLWMTSTFLFMEGISRPRPGMIIMLSILPLNILLNAWLIPGGFGVSAMGASGAALATILAQAVGAIAMYIYLKKMKDRREFGLENLSLRPWKANWRTGKAMRRFGLAPGIAASFEFMGWLVLNQASGYFGHNAVGAMQILISLHAISFAAVMGIASATSVRVGNAVGRHDHEGIIRITKRAILLVICAMAPFIALYSFGAPITLTLFDAGIKVSTLAMALMLGWAPFIIFDGIQFVLLFALRAAGDEKWASYLQITAFMGVMSITGLSAAFLLGFEVRGLVFGMIAGMTSAAALLILRFAYVAKTLPERLHSKAA